MRKLQFRVLYREFLFRLADRDVLSVSAQGDAGRLLGQLATLLILLSIPFAFAILHLGNSRLPHHKLLVTAWGAEHALIATTMLIVGLFAVLSWDSAYPDRRDVLVLAPLPIRASTIFLSKIAALAVALSLTIVIFNTASFLVLPLAFAPPEATPLDLLLSITTYRLIAAFWITMFASGAFISCAPFWPCRESSDDCRGVYTCEAPRCCNWLPSACSSSGTFLNHLCRLGMPSPRPVIKPY